MFFPKSIESWIIVKIKQAAIEFLIYIDLKNCIHKMRIMIYSQMESWYVQLLLKQNNHQHLFYKIIK